MPVGEKGSFDKGMNDLDSGSLCLILSDTHNSLIGLGVHNGRAHGATEVKAGPLLGIRDELRSDILIEVPANLKRQAPSRCTVLLHARFPLIVCSTPIQPSLTFSAITTNLR